jgi:magnesium chelatase subunit D
LELAQQFVTAETLLVLVTDGRANVPTRSDDAWSDALRAATGVRCAALVVDTESSDRALGRAKELADAMRAEFVSLTAFEAGYDFPVLLRKSTNVAS